jgi:O-antigen/teichoic acid export membrane protein
MQAYSLLNVLLASLQVLAAFWLYRTHGNLIQLALALLVVQVVAAALAGLVCGQGFPVRLHLSTAGFARLRALVVASSPIALLGLLGVIYQRSSILMLPGLAGTTVAGLFSAGSRLIEAAKTGHIAMLTALYPMMAEGWARDRRNWARSFRIPVLILLSGALLGSVLLWLLAAPLVRILFGSEYLPSVPVVRILAWVLAPYAVNSFLTLALLARTEERVIVTSLALSTALLVALTVWWTARAGAPGAAWAALCAEAAQSVLLLALSPRRSQVAPVMVT